MTEELVRNPLLLLPKNALCLCGSGKRFKLCHRPRLPRMIPPDMAVENFKHMEKLKEKKR